MVAIVQAASNTGTSTVTVTLGAGTTAGSCLPACIAMGSGGGLATVSGVTLGGSADHWAQLAAAGNLLTGAEQLAVWADPACAGGQTAVAITVSGAAVTLAQVFEASGIAASSILDQSATADSGGATSGPAFSLTAGATAQASELAVACTYGYNQTVTGPSSPWVNEATLTSTTRDLQASYQILSSAGTVTYSGSYGAATFNGQIVVTLKAAGSAPAVPPAAPPPLIRPHPYGLIRDEAQQRADWQAQGVADLTVAFSSSSGGVDTYNVTSPWNGTSTYQMRVLAPAAPNPDYPHGFLLMLPVQQNQDTSPYGDSIGTAQAIAAHNGWNLTCVQPGYAPLPVNSEGPWFADNPLSAAISQEKFTLLVTAWIRQHLAVTGLERVYLIGFSRSGLGGQNLLLRHPYMYAACASWDTPYGMTDYDGTDPIRGTTVGGDPQDGYGTSANFTNHYQLTANRLAGLQATGQYGINRIWLGNGAVNTPDFAWYDALLTTAGVPHTSTFSNTAEAHAWQADWVAAALEAIIPSQVPTALPQQYASYPVFTRLLEVAAYRAAVGAPAAVTHALPLPASLVVSGSLGRTTGRLLAAALVVTSVLGRGISRALAASLAAAASVVRNPGKALAAALAVTGSLARGTGRTLASAAALAGSLGRGTGRTMPAGVIVTAAETRGTGKILAATAVATGTVTRGISRALPGSLTLAGAGSFLKVKILALTASLVLNGTLTRNIGRSLSAGAVATGSLVRNPGKILTAGAVVAGSLARGAGKRLSAALSLAGSLLTGSARFLNLPASLSLTGSLTAIKVKLLTLTASLAVNGSLGRNVGKGMTASAVLAGSVRRQCGKGLSGGLSAGASLGRGIGRAFRAALTAIGSGTFGRGGTNYPLTFSAGLGLSAAWAGVVSRITILFSVVNARRLWSVTTARRLWSVARARNGSE